MSLSKFCRVCQSGLTKERVGGGVAVVLFTAFLLKRSGMRPKTILHKALYGNKSVHDESVEKSNQKIVKKIKAKEKSKSKVVDKNFVKQLTNLLKIIIPSLKSQQFLLLLAQTLTLIIRTCLSIIVARLDGQIVRSIVQKAPLNFAASLLRWLMIAVPATFINSLIRFFEAKIALSFKSRLVSHAYQLYFKDQTYYRVSNLDNRLTSVDQNLTEDLTSFASSLSHLFSHLTKPILDIVVVCVTLYKTAHQIGANISTSTMIGVSVISSTALILKTISPHFGKLISAEADKKGLLRAAHSRIITNAEEIAFYAGHKAEEQQLMECYKDLHKQSNTLYWKRLWYVQMEQFLMKYMWSASGLLMISIPILSVELGFSNRGKVYDDDKVQVKENGVSVRTQLFTTSRSLLLSLADAFERLMSSYKEVTELAGYTERVTQMFEVFDDVSKCKYVMGGHDNDADNDDDNTNDDDGYDNDDATINNDNNDDANDDSKLKVRVNNGRKSRVDDDDDVDKGRNDDDDDDDDKGRNDDDDEGLHNNDNGPTDTEMVMVARRVNNGDDKVSRNDDGGEHDDDDDDTHTSENKTTRDKDHHHQHPKSHQHHDDHHHHHNDHHHHHHHHRHDHHHDQVMTYRRGVVRESSHDISLEGVAIVTPTNHVVVKDLSFKLEKGMDLLISGPNGCGKSSLFRVLSGLWGVGEGIVCKPPPHTIFYIPQKPYMAVGNLRDQIIYPDNEGGMKEKGVVDADLMVIVRTVGLTPLFNRNINWESVCDWKSMLSGGEKQKIGMARIFYHRPQYALLDECSSAISIDYEASIYEAIKQQHITILSISHRPSLWKFHSHILQLDGEGGWRFEKLNQDCLVSMKEEKKKLEDQLSGIPQVERRLREVCRSLGEWSHVLEILEGDDGCDSSSSTGGGSSSTGGSGGGSSGSNSGGGSNSVGGDDGGSGL